MVIFGLAKNLLFKSVLGHCAICSVNRENKLCALLIGVFPTHEIEDVLACFELLPTNPTHRGGNATTTYRDAF